MILPAEAVLEFKQIYLDVYGVDISLEEATSRASNLVSLYQVVLDPGLLNDKAIYEHKRDS